jgi:hypothetical protein
VAPFCKAFRILLIDGSIRIGAAASRHRWRTRITFSLSDHIVANSYAGLAAHQIPAEKGSVVYNAIDPDRLESLKQKSNVQKGITTVIMTGRISPLRFSSGFQCLCT